MWFSSAPLLYLRARWRVILLLFICVALNALVCVLSDVPWDVILYGLALALGAALAFGAVDFPRFIRKRRALSMMIADLPLGLERMPAPTGAIEAEYQALILSLRDRMAAAQNARDAREKEALTYYTLWAHQIKTPIAAMRLLLESNARDKADMQAELFKVERYVEMALNFVKLDGDVSDLVLKRVPLEGIVKGAVRKYAKLFIVKKLRLELSPIRQTVLTDEKWLSFAIEQVLFNALKYTNSGAIRVYEDGCGALVIEDTGVGIRKEDLPRVFDKGFTGLNGRQDQKATGLGLYLCKMTLKKLSHDISIESEAGKGTRVYFHLESADLSVE